VINLHQGQFQFNAVIIDVLGGILSLFIGKKCTTTTRVVSCEISSNLLLIPTFDYCWTNLTIQLFCNILG